ncbi:MAG: hypothetical protein U0S36_12545 [Candidatus Nanopelagicales bacterium]
MNGLTADEIHRRQGHVRARNRHFGAVCPRCGGTAEQGWLNASDGLDDDWWTPGAPICFDVECREGAQQFA